PPRPAPRRNRKAGARVRPAGSSSPSTRTGCWRRSTRCWAELTRGGREDGAAPQGNRMPAGMRRVREFEFTDADFNSLRQLVREVAGISLADCKRELVYSRLS